MEQHGYVRKDQAGGRYYLGLKLLSLSNIQMRDVNLRDMAAPVLEDLVRRTGLTAHLAILDRGEAVYIDKKEPEGFLKINSWIGKRNYVHTSAVGKALVAGMEAEGVQRIWESGLPRRTAHTVSSWKKFKAELAAARTAGYAIDKEEDEIGGRCVAAPVFNASGNAAAAIGLSGIVSQVPDERIPVLGGMLRSAAELISARLGYRPVRQPDGNLVQANRPSSAKSSG
jgi:DNA-binding IclR family transcriptional regulator